MLCSDNPWSKNLWGFKHSWNFVFCLHLKDFFKFKFCLKLFFVSSSVIRNSEFGGFSILVLLYWDLCQVPSWFPSAFFPSMCYQCQLGVFNQPRSLVVAAAHGMSAWDLCWASPAPQHHLCLWKLQRVRELSAKLRCQIRGVNCVWQEKAAKHKALCHHSFLTIWVQQGRSVLSSVATQ